MGAAREIITRARRNLGAEIYASRNKDLLETRFELYDHTGRIPHGPRQPAVSVHAASVWDALGRDSVLAQDLVSTALGRAAQDLAQTASMCLGFASALITRPSTTWVWVGVGLKCVCRPVHRRVALRVGCIALLPGLSRGRGCCARQGGCLSTTQGAPVHHTRLAS